MDPEQSCLDSTQQEPQTHWKQAACSVSMKELLQNTEAFSFILTNSNCSEGIYMHYTNHQYAE
eukprot:3618752-Ditylum_brightwellii.AAC.1